MNLMANQSNQTTDERDIKSIDEELLENDFSTFKITPIFMDHNKEYEKAIYIPESPGRGVCLSNPKFRFLMSKNYESKAYEKLLPCEEPGLFDSLGAIGVGVIVGIVGVLLVEKVSQ